MEVEVGRPVDAGHDTIYIYIYDRETFRVYLPPWVLFTINIYIYIIYII